MGLQGRNKVLIWVIPLGGGGFKIQEKSRWDWRKVCDQDSVWLDCEFNVNCVNTWLTQLGAKFAIEHEGWTDIKASFSWQDCVSRGWESEGFRCG